VDVFKVLVSGDERALLVALRTLQTQIELLIGAAPPDAPEDADPGGEAAGVLPETPDSVRRVLRFVRLLIGKFSKGDGGGEVAGKLLSLLQKLSADEKVVELGVAVGQRLSSSFISRSVSTVFRTDNNDGSTN
jgi:hypothetical protein